MNLKHFWQFIKVEGHWKDPKEIILVTMGVIFIFFIVFSLIQQGYHWIKTQQEQLATNNTPKEIIARTKEELCITGKFNELLKDEIKYNDEVSKDDFVKYLRISIDDFLNKKYETKNCSYFGFLVNHVHCADSAYDSVSGPVLFSENTDFLREKFIVLQADIAPGGGESIVLMFKSKPDEILYAWVYNTGDWYYDLRAFHKYEHGGDGNDLSALEAQRTHINQLCNENTGI